MEILEINEIKIWVDGFNRDWRKESMKWKIKQWILTSLNSGEKNRMKTKMNRDPNICGLVTKDLTSMSSQSQKKK